MIENRKINGLGIKDLRYMETSRGLAYSAKITMGGKAIGLMQNDGNGGYTKVEVEPEFRNEFHEKVISHLKEVEISTDDHKEYAIYYTFAEHLLDVHEEGKLDKCRKKDGILV